MEKEIYIAFLRSCCKGILEDFVKDKRMDWKSLFSFSHKQALVGVVFNAVVRLPAEVAPPKELLMKLYSLNDRVRKMNMVLNRDAAGMCAMLKEKGLECCLLKGQGNAVMYEDVYSRMPGDIDIWVNADRKKVMDFVNENFDCDGMRFHHVEFTYGKGSPVELHFFPLYLNNPVHNARLQRWFRENAERQCGNFIDLPDGAGRVPVPTAEFNAVYQMGHIFHHFFDDGIGLRQLMDYCYVLKGLSEEERKRTAERLGYFGMKKFAGAVMYVLREAFGLEEGLMPVAPDCARGERLLNEIMDGGNFGKHFKKYGAFNSKGTAQKYFLKIYRNMHFVREYPAEALCEPVFRTWHFFWRISNRNL